MQISRRGFGKFAAMAGVALASTAQDPLLEAESATSSQILQFPHSFTWGTATASYQIEGAVHEDGRGLSIWDTYSHTPGKIVGGDNADTATDSYHRYKEDIALMKSLGVNASRFSISWPRIFPNGTGSPNSKGVDYYRRYVDELRNAGIEPFCTLYHWDLPQPLQDKGGWQSKDTAKAFADYCGYITRQLGPQVTQYMTMNEMRSFIDIAYGQGRQAPGLKLRRRELAQARHWAVYGHGLGMAAIRASSSKARVGTAENGYMCVPALNSEEHIAAARKATLEENASYLTVMHTGKYTEGYMARLGKDAPVFTQEELDVISSPTDFQGLNIYSGVFVQADDGPAGYKVLPFTKSYPRMASQFINIVPGAMYWGPKLIVEQLGVKEIYITENGCSAEDTVDPDGSIYDIERVMFLRAYLTELKQGIHEGVPVRGYFVWSLLDNYEWSEGYSKRFGIVYVDFQTQKRTPKLSAKFYKNLISGNRL